MFDLITTAYAESGTASTGSGMSSILMIVVMLAIFYFLLIRPENKRKKQAPEFRSLSFVWNYSLLAFSAFLAALAFALAS